MTTLYLLLMNGVHFTESKSTTRHIQWINACFIILLCVFHSLHSARTNAVSSSMTFWYNSTVFPHTASLHKFIPMFSNNWYTDSEGHNFEACQLTIDHFSVLVNFITMTQLITHTTIFILMTMMLFQPK